MGGFSGMTTVAEWKAFLDGLYPPAWAEPWDNVGLQVGDPVSSVSRILFALDPTIEVVREAVSEQAQLVVTHHPLLFEPLSSVDASHPVSAVVTEAIRSEVAMISCHTNADVASPGVSDALCWQLGLSVEGPLQATRAGASSKLATFVPVEATHQVLEAMSRAGAGIVGEYDVCSFRSPGTGTFRPSAQANPAKGKRRTINEVDEERLEMIVPAERVGEVVAAVRQAHPYEEPAIDVVALEVASREVGLGRVALPSESTTVEGLLEMCRERLGGAPRLVGDPAATVARVAVCGGSGASLVPAASSHGCEALITGDVKHHQARDALAAGLSVIDAGHHATEWPWVPHVAELVSRAGGDIVVSAVPTDPFGSRA